MKDATSIGYDGRRNRVSLECHMRHTIHLGLVLVALFSLALPMRAQTRPGIVGELLRDIGQVENKVIGLAKALPEAAWAWRPGTGVRSTQEVFMHIAADNYFMPTLLGTAAPAETKITSNYDTAAAFEKQPMNRDAVMAELQKSFAFLKTSLSNTPDAKLEASANVFGSRNTTRGVWVMTATHLHEHLGQLIAYARSNNVTPPWSK
jgi:uncharacterized damage-inducible protein DinB